MEINDKRKFTADGDMIEQPSEETISVFTENLNRIFLSEVPRVYGDPEPMGDYLFVRQGVAQTTYAGTNFVIPESAQQSPNDGVVVAIGPDIDSAKIAPGDLVTFGKFNAEPIEIDGEIYQNVRIHDIKVRRKVTYAVNA